MIKRNAMGIATTMIGALRRTMLLTFPSVRKFGAPSTTNRTARPANPNGRALRMTKPYARR